jgi:UDP-glucose 4-epimerase
MTILVTGGTGYIGSVTVELLQKRGEAVVILDDLRRGHRESLDSDVPFYQGKVGDRALIARIAKEHKIDSCIHFAALTYVGESVRDPAMYFENNVEQGIAFVASLDKAGVRLIVFSSSAATYGEPKRVPIEERDPQWPENPYGWSKLIMERLFASYDRGYGLKFVSLRYFNAAGATQRCGEHHDPETHLIPNVLSAAADPSSDIAIFGNKYPTPDGTAIRDYIHVADLGDAHIRALDHLRRGGASEFLNLGTGHGHSVLEVIDSARKVTGRPVRTRIEPPRAGDPARLVADATKAQAVLGWTPVSDLETIIRSAWEWKVRHPKGYAS